MSETAKHEDDRWTHRLARRFGLAAVVLCCWAGSAAAEMSPARRRRRSRSQCSRSRSRISARRTNKARSPDVTIYLAQSTEEAKKQLAQSGRYTLIDTAGADIGAAKEHGLRNCGGCEAAIAKKLGAEQALIGVVTKISMTEYNVRIQVSDAAKRCRGFAAGDQSADGHGGFVVPGSSLADEEPDAGGEVAQGWIFVHGRRPSSGCRHLLPVRGGDRATTKFADLHLEGRAVAEAATSPPYGEMSGRRMRGSAPPKSNCPKAAPFPRDIRGSARDTSWRTGWGA